MQSIHFHIAYLLTRHECVIVPGLGAFLVSSPDREKANRWGIISPPETFLGFNSEIKHNDGLLANSLIKEEKCSLKEANLLIDQYVADVLQSLNEGKRVHIPWVGSLHSIENKKLFQPERILSCNAFNYGLVGFSLPSVKELQQKPETNVFPRKKDKEVVWIPVHKKFITYSVSVAAAILAMCVIPTPLNNGHSNQEARVQYASLISLPANKAAITVNQVADTLETKIPAPVDPVLKQKKTETPSSKVMNPVKTDGYYYYVVIASLPDQSSAKKILNEFRSKGIENASILSSNGKYRIYTNRFENKVEAGKFLIQFRKDHPTNENAWVLKQKPN